MSAPTKGKAKKAKRTTKKQAVKRAATQLTAEVEKHLLSQYKAGVSPTALAADYSWAREQANPANAVRRAMVRAAGGLAEFEKIMAARRKAQR